MRIRRYIGGGPTGGTDPATPVFASKEEHDTYYKNLLLEKVKKERPELYEDYMGALNSNGESPLKGDLDTVIALAGGIPTYKTPSHTTFDGSTSRIKNIAFKPNPTEGYRYGENRPDVESITNNVRRFGGLLTYKKLGGKIKYGPGGSLITDYSFPTSIDVNAPDFKSRIPLPNSATSPDNTSRGFNTGKLNDILPFATNIANSFSRLPKPITPVLEQTLNPELVNYNADRAEIDRIFRGTSRGIDESTNNVSQANAAKVANLSKILEAKGRLSQAEQNQNAAIKNQTNQANSAISARNVERTNSFQNELTARRLKQQQLQQANLANASDKIQLAAKDKSLMDLENRKLGILLATDKDTGTFSRNLYDNYLKELYGQKKYGGSIHINPANKGKFTAFAKRHGMGVQEAASHVLANKGNYSSTIVKRANFARNFGRK